MMQFYPNSICPICKVEVGYHDENQIKQCWKKMKSEDQASTAITTLKQSGYLSTSFGNQTFETLNPAAVALNPDSWYQVEGWLNSDSMGLYLYGSPGTGKTHAARCVMNQAVNAGYTIMETSAHKIIQKNGRYSDELFNYRLEDVAILLIDDIDKAIWNESSISILWQLLNAREDIKARTIITTNVPADKFRSIFNGGDIGNGSIIESMIQRLHPITTIGFHGESVRGMV